MQKAPKFCTSAAIFFSSRQAKKHLGSQAQEVKGIDDYFF